MISSEWDENKRTIRLKMREFSAEMSELSRLFQRVVMKGNTSQRTQLKVILRETNQRLSALLNDID